MPSGKRPAEADPAAVRAWFEMLAEHVRSVDYSAARSLFAPDLIAFGTFTDFVEGRAEVEQAQWRNVWGRTDDFRWRPDIRVIISPDRLQAVGMGVFDSTGYAAGGTAYDRPGRATVVLVRRNPEDVFVAQHTHMSLFRDVPTQSHGHKPEKESAA